MRVSTRVRQLARDDDQRLLGFGMVSPALRLARPCSHGGRSALFNRARRHCAPHSCAGATSAFLASRWPCQDKAFAAQPFSGARSAVPSYGMRALPACCSGVRRRGAGAGAPAGTASGLPVPRFVSLKSDRVNVRGGPTKDHDVAWVFTRAGPAGRDHRRIRELAPHPRLGGRRGLGLPLAAVAARRTAVVTAEAKDELVALSRAARPTERDVAAQLAARRARAGEALRPATGAASPAAASTAGSPQERLWGVYPNEKVD